MNEKRFAKYPTLLKLAQEMSEDGRKLVRSWHTALTSGLEGYAGHVRKEFAKEWSAEESRLAVFVVESWLKTMREVSGVLSDTRDADWCCQHGMLAYPQPCPQHGGAPATSPASLPLATVLRCPLPKFRGRVVKVADHSDNPHPWYGIDNPISYTDGEVTNWEIVAIGVGDNG